jgi:CheY-like chemotaxis protein
LPRAVDLLGTDREEASLVTSLLRPDKNPRPAVLVIDDDEEIRTTIKDVLEDQGFAVTCAANGREALDLLLRDDAIPALILLDLMMPEMDGWTFRQEQQKVARLAQIPVVLFSGHLDAGRAALSLNAVAMMAKPLRLDGLVTLVDRLSRRGKPN